MTVDCQRYSGWNFDPSGDCYTGRDAGASSLASRNYDPSDDGSTRSDAGAGGLAGRNSDPSDDGAGSDAGAGGSFGKEAGSTARALDNRIAR